MTQIVQSLPNVRCPLLLQEAFGMLATPTLAGGEVPILMELLSPAGKPLQVRACVLNSEQLLACLLVCFMARVEEHIVP